MINALEVFIQYLKGAGISTANIASKHRYGSSWEVGTSGIVARLDGGDPNLYVETQEIRVEVRCFAADDVLALDLLNEILELSRTDERKEQVVLGGTGLLYFFKPDSGPSIGFDPDLNMDFALMFFSVMVSERGI